MPCTRAIVSSLGDDEDAAELSVSAFQTALELKNVDSFVLAYRACPQLLAMLPATQQLRMKSSVKCLRVQMTKVWPAGMAFPLLMPDVMSCHRANARC